VIVASKMWRRTYNRIYYRSTNVYTPHVYTVLPAQQAMNLIRRNVLFSQLNSGVLPLPMSIM
jgi:hypothetical protein